ncbi:MAG: SUMF1/EgtB/PvdO family nonheme iron enzyme [Candidatus Riflebacteria bacterium]|nr:SUMF1/EgtB/PvdO family nonheme iron enzyme [Candidatus Riflebacteria bacterium]
MPDIYFSVLFFGMLLQLGCWLFPQQPAGPGEVLLVPPIVDSSITSVRFEFLSNKSNIGSPSASIIAETASNPYVLFQLVQVNKGNPASPSTTIATISPIISGSASATFKGIPAKTTVGKVSIVGGTKNGHSEFHGSSDLKAFQDNTIYLSFVGANDSEDIAANVIEMIIASSSAFEKVVDGLSDKVKTVVASHTNITPNIYSEVLYAFLGLTFPASDTSTIGTATTYVAFDESNVVLSEETRSFVLENEVLVTFKEKPTIDEIHQTEQKIGGTVIGSFPTLLTYSFKVKAVGGTAVVNTVNALDNDARLTNANYNVSAHQIFYASNVPNDPDYATNWGIGKIQASQTWDYLPSTTVEVAVVDTGARSTHEDLRDVLDKTNGHNFTQKNNGDTTNFEDEHGHGTHVSGIIAASVNNARGIAGAAPNVKVVPIKCLEKQPDGRAVGSIANISLGIEYASNIANVRVINLSLGSPGFINPMIKNAIDGAVRKGKLVVVAAGNENDDASYYSPAYYENCFTVGATTVTDSRAYYSNYNTNGAPIDIAAPGDQIFSCGVVSDSSYVFMSGTSMSTPFVSALAAAVFSVKPGLTPGQVRSLIQQNADPIVTDKDIGKRINFLNTINAALGGTITDQPPTVTITGSTTVDPGQTYSFKAVGVDSDDASLTFSCSSNSGTTPVITVTTPKESDATWIAPDKGGNYSISCRVVDSKNVSGDGSLAIYVRPKPVVVSYITPTAGKSGSVVNITGIAFGDTKGDSIVKFNGSSVSDIISWSDSSIQIKIPIAASSGLITVTVNSIESNGVKFDIDDVPPTAVFVQTPVTPSNQISATFKVGGDDVVLYKYKLDSGTWGSETPVSNPISLSGLNEGEHNIYSVGRDTAGNWQSDASPTKFTWVIDTTSPVVILSGAPPALTNNIAINITVGGDGVVAYKYKLDDNAWTTESNVSTGIVVSSLAQGSHILRVIGRDSAGNWQSDSAPTTMNWTINTTAPKVELSNLPSVLTNTTSAAIQVAGTNVAYYKYFLDSSTLTSEVATATPITLTSLAEGNHRLAVIGRDFAGNWQSINDATVATWQIDLTPPTAALSNTPPNPTNQTTANINVSGTDVAYYKYKLDSGTWSNEISVSSPISLTSLSEGAHSISVIGRDLAGNWQNQNSSTNYSWTISFQTHTAIFTVFPNNPTNQTVASFTIGGDGVIDYKYKIDSGSWSNPASVSVVISLTSLAEGSHTISVIGKDSANNWQNQSSSTNYSWQIDLTPPIAGLSDTPSSVTNQTVANITVNGNGVTKYKYKIDSGSWSTEKNVSEKIGLPALAQGSHSILVIGCDAAGNWQSENSGTSFSWVVDTTPPNASLIAKPASVINQTNSSFSIGGDGVTLYRYKLDSGSWSSDCTTSTLIDLTNLADGIHQISIIGRDSAGNWQSDTQPTIYSWTIDTTPPTAQLTNTPGNPTSQNAASISVSGSDVSFYKFRLDGGSWSAEIAISNPISLSNLTGGSHTLTVIGRDSAGNWQSESSQTSYSWVISVGLPTSENCYTIQPGPIDGQDTCYGTVYAADGCSDTQTLYMGGWGDYYYDFFQFNISQGPSASDTLSAYLYLYCPAYAEGSNPNFQVNRITQSWTEGSVTRSNNPTSVYYKDFGQWTFGGWNKVDITDLYKNWKNGTYTNNGVKLVPTNNNRTNGLIYASENTDSGHRPALVIEHLATETLTEIDLGSGVKMNFVQIPAGSFLMGCPETEPQLDWEKRDIPQHQVTISKGFYIGKYEVTQEQYQVVMGSNPSSNQRTNKLPVETVSWLDAILFCNKLSEKYGIEKVYTINGASATYDFNNSGFRLPTEAEWELACRANTTTAFYWGSSNDGAYCWNSDNSGNQQHEVGLKLPNAFGIYDMSGNVFEWCNDFLATYTSTPQIDPKGPETGAYKIFRGGTWFGLPGWACRSAARYYGGCFDDRRDYIGIRVARNQ